MKFRIKSRAKAHSNGNDKYININEILVFDYTPSNQDIQDAFDEHPSHKHHMLIFTEPFTVEKVSN